MRMEFGHHVLPGFGTLAYLTMEFVEGETLGARLRKRPRLALNEVMVLCRQILRGLRAAHAVGVLHRDLTSDNVMLRTPFMSDGELHAVIMDFGVARLLGDLIVRSDFPRLERRRRPALGLATSGRGGELWSAPPFRLGGVARSGTELLDQIDHLHRWIASQRRA